MLILVKLIVTVVSILATLILLILNLRANRISRMAIEEMIRSREEVYRPYVYLDIQFKEHEMDILMKNVGKAPAYNVRFQLDQDILIWTSLTSSADKQYKIKDMGISHEIEMLSPQEEYREWMDTSFRFFQKNTERRLTGKLQYDNGAGAHFSFPIDIDLTPYEQRHFTTEKGMSELVNSLENLRRDLDMKWR